jgi:hypothetical protein
LEKLHDFWLTKDLGNGSHLDSVQIPVFTPKSLIVKSMIGYKTAGRIKPLGRDKVPVMIPAFGINPDVSGFTRFKLLCECPSAAQ